MKYTVLSEFADLQDNKYVYGIGDEYPREGYSPTAERIAELSTGKNLLHTPLIERIEEPKPVVQEQVPVVQEVVEAVVEEPKKRGRKKKDDA